MYFIPTLDSNKTNDKQNEEEEEKEKEEEEEEAHGSGKWMELKRNSFP